jgi:hypothetical protein
MRERSKEEREVVKRKKEQFAFSFFMTIDFTKLFCYLQIENDCAIEYDFQE